MTNNMLRLAQLLALALCPLAACGPGLESSPGWSDRWEVCGQLGGSVLSWVDAGPGVLVLSDIERFEVHDLPSGALRFSIPELDELRNERFSVSPDGTLLVVPGRGYLARWSLSDGVRLDDLVLSDTPDIADVVVWSPDSKRLAIRHATGASPGMVKLLSMPDGELVGTVPASPPAVLALPDSDTLVVVQSSEVIRYRIADRVEIGRTPLPLGRSIRAVSPDGSLVLVAREVSLSNVSSEVIRASDGNVLWTMTAYVGQFSADGRFVTGSDGNTAKTWAASDGILLLDGVRLGTSRDGSTVFSVGGNGVTLYGASLSPMASILHPAAGGVTAMSFSRDSALVATASGEIALWTVNRQSLVWAKAAPGAVTSLDFSPDGTLLLAAGPRAPGTLWRVSDGVLLHTFNDPDSGDTLYSLAFSDDGQTIVAGPAATPTIRMWRTADLVELKPLQTTRQNTAAIIAGHQLLTSAPEVWTLDPPVLWWRAPEEMMPPSCPEGGDWVMDLPYRGVLAGRSLSQVAKLFQSQGRSAQQLNGGSVFASGYFSVDLPTGAVWGVDGQRLGSLPVQGYLAAGTREPLVAVGTGIVIGTTGTQVVQLVCDRQYFREMCQGNSVHDELWPPFCDQ